MWYISHYQSQTHKFSITKSSQSWQSSCATLNVSDGEVWKSSASAAACLWPDSLIPLIDLRRRGIVSSLALRSSASQFWSKVWSCCHLLLHELMEWHPNWSYSSSSGNEWQLWIPCAAVQGVVGCMWDFIKSAAPRSATQFGFGWNLSLNPVLHVGEALSLELPSKKKCFLILICHRGQS